MKQERKLTMVERLESVRARIVAADADPRASLSDDEVERHFAARLRAERGTQPGGDAEDARSG